MSETATLGRRGEQLAAMFLEQNGFHVLHRNYRTDHKEIDLIASNDISFIFCEVKTRTVTSCNTIFTSPYGRPSRAVNAAKKKNLSAAARAYLKEHPVTGLRIRFDVIEVYIRKGTTGSDARDILKIHHIPNAFYATPVY